MRRLVVLVLVLSGLGYLAMDWRSRSEAAQVDDGIDGFAQRPAVPLERPVPPQATPAEEAAVPAARPRQDPGLGARGSRSPELGPGQGGASDDGVRLSLSTVDPVELSLTLLEAWGDDKPDRLEQFMADKGVSDGQKRLITAFWWALIQGRAAAADLLDGLEGERSVSAAQLQMVRLALGEGGAVEASYDYRADPLARAMRMVLGDVEFEDAAKNADPRRMALAISDLMLLELGAPWAPRTPVLERWAADLAQAQAGHRLNPAGDWPFFEYQVQNGDSLVLIRKRVMQSDPTLNVNVGLLREVNGLGQFIHEGDLLRIPTAKARVIVDLDARMLLYLHDGEVVRAWKVGIGREGQETPVGEWTVGEKLAEPDYMPVGKTPLPYGHPDNPLGSRWLGLYRAGKDTSYGIHGTGEPAGVGGMVSEGCIRMRNEDVEELFDLLPLNSEVRIQP